MEEKEKSLISRRKRFQPQWFDENPSWKIWLRSVPNDNYKFFCVACKKYYESGKAKVIQHANSEIHKVKIKELDIVEDEEMIYPGASKEGHLDFNDKVKVAEIKLATFFVEHNIPFTYSAELLTIFKEIGKEPDVLQSMSLGKTKLRNIITNVLCPYETARITNKLQNHKFSVFEDETSDISNEKKMTLLTRYVDSKSLRVEVNLLQLINLDASDCSADKLFKAFSSELIKKEIPISQIIGLSCDNASVMVGKHDSFQTRLLKNCPRLVTMPCICHSSALVASNACKTLPVECGNFIKKIVTFINGSPKRTAIFKDFQQSFEKETKNLLKYAETRWLSRHTCIERILEQWNIIHTFLLELMSENKSQAEEMLLSMNNPETKAYLYFLENVLKKFNSFNAFFQASETRIHVLHKSCMKFLMFLLQKFIKPALLKDEILIPYLRNIDFGRTDNQLPLQSIDIGPDCAEYLEDGLIEEKLNEEQIQLIRQNCLSFLIKASQEVRNRFPIFDKFLENLNIFQMEKALFDEDRETSSIKLLEICRLVGYFDEHSIKIEWTSLYSNETYDVKTYWSKLSFDNMWQAICSAKNSNKELRYPQLRALLNLVRSLPHSNAEAERCFSIIPDSKTRKRNKLSHETLNAICVVKYALRSKEETSLSMTVTKQHLELMKNLLYSSKLVTAKSNLNLHAYEDSDDDTEVE
ncbi:zinc finger MYM-type protein 6-like [Prorops nasuta]|uniref:zinc finger MYM-type protein 6-like n=1 Tax=Prorops nasuta TaxID=863751 RepID=UPI0034CF29F5